MRLALSGVIPTASVTTLESHPPHARRSCSGFGWPERNTSAPVDGHPGHDCLDSRRCDLRVGCNLMSIDKSASPHSDCTRPPFAASAPLPRRSRHRPAHAAPMTVLAYARLATLSTIAAVMRHQRYWACASFVCPSAFGACHFGRQLIRSTKSHCQDVQKRNRNQHERQTSCDSTVRTIERTKGLGYH